jgi:hypothetical protein
MDGRDAIERAVREWIGEMVQIHQHIRAAGGIPVDSDGARLLVNAATNIKDSPLYLAVHRRVSIPILSTILRAPS